jgi:probable F420-dependent oxidoreductase
MRFMLQYPDLNGMDGDLLDAGPIPELAAAAERSGWLGLSFTEHPAPGARWLEAGGHQTLDPFVALAAAAAVTAKIRLLTYLSVAPYRNPLMLAKAAATVDKVSNGRFTLGIGTGYLKGEFRAVGADFDERNELFDEALDVLPLHWSGEPFSYEGRHFSARDIMARPRPVQNPIPIWIGGNAKITLRRVAMRAQGWMPMVGAADLSATTRTPHLDSIDAIAESLKVLRDLAGDRFEALEIAVPSHGHLGDPLVEVGQHQEYYGRLAEIGVHWMVVAPGWAPAPATVSFIEAFAQTYFV